MLVVEDERSLCNAITKGLRLDGYEVDSCLDGNEAWDMILAERYDLIILDLNLPGMDGMEILRSLYYRVVVFRVPLQGHMLHCKGCCGLVQGSYRKTVHERLQPQSFTVLLIS